MIRLTTHTRRCLPLPIVFNVQIDPAASADPVEEERGGGPIVFYKHIETPGVSRRRRL